MDLAVPLSQTQIEVAKELHSKLGQWQIADKALLALSARFPGFDLESTLLKVVAINQLYSTNVYAIMRMAEHIAFVMHQEGTSKNIELVEKIASLPRNSREERELKRHSFASKFAHFFIDSERFPIYDSYAIKIVRYHLGKPKTKQYSYLAFVEDIHILKQAGQLNCSTRELDHYLWLAGLYSTWRKRKIGVTHTKLQMNVEVKKLFEEFPDKAATLLPELKFTTSEV